MKVGNVAIESSGGCASCRVDGAGVRARLAEMTEPRDFSTA